MRSIRREKRRDQLRKHAAPVVDVRKLQKKQWKWHLLLTRLLLLKKLLLHKPNLTESKCLPAGGHFFWRKGFFGLPPP
jgi:hypothetical protein